MKTYLRLPDRDFDRDFDTDFDLDFDERDCDECRLWLWRGDGERWCELKMTEMHTHTIL